MSTALKPDFKSIKDLTIGEMTPAQKDDAHEAWLRTQVGWMGQYHIEHYQFLFRRLDECRKESLK